MRKYYPKLLLFFLLVLAISLLLSSCSPPNLSPTGSTSVGTSDPGETLDGKTLMQERCSICHTTGRITSKSATLDQWTVTVDRMISKGTQLDSVERETLIQFLTQTYP